MVMPLPFQSPAVNHARIVAAIQSAERRTSGEIRVVISRGEPRDAVAEATRQFERLGMTRTAERNGVLIYVALAARRFAVIGDTAVHAKCGDAFWSALAAAMQSKFSAGEIDAAIVLGIERAGELLAEHFPIQAGDRNELPDDVDETD
jgi:uncharacterized membrane protein